MITVAPGGSRADIRCIDHATDRDPRDLVPLHQQKLSKSLVLADGGQFPTSGSTGSIMDSESGALPPFSVEFESLFERTKTTVRFSSTVSTRLADIHLWCREHTSRLRPSLRLDREEKSRVTAAVSASKAINDGQKATAGASASAAIRRDAGPTAVSRPVKKAPAGGPA